MGLQERPFVFSVPFAQLLFNSPGPLKRAFVVFVARRTFLLSGCAAIRGAWHFSRAQPQTLPDSFGKQASCARMSLSWIWVAVPGPWRRTLRACSDLMESTAESTSTLLRSNGAGGVCGEIRGSSFFSLT